jgi:hypothetical protein
MKQNQYHFFDRAFWNEPRKAIVRHYFKDVTASPILICITAKALETEFQLTDASSGELMNVLDRHWVKGDRPIRPFVERLILEKLVRDGGVFRDHELVIDTLEGR